MISEFSRLLKDEFIVKYSILEKKNVKFKYQSGIAKDSRTGLVFELMYRAGYTLMSGLNYFKLLLFRSRVDVSHSEKVFIYKDPRNMRFALKEGAICYRVGLHHLDSSEHLYQILPKWMLVLKVFEALILTPYAFARTYLFCSRNEINCFEYCFVNNLGCARLIDFLIFNAALEALKDCEISFSEQHNIYVSTLSEFRKRGNFKKLVCYQHGLFVNPGSLSFNKYYVDEYHLIFRESENFFRKELNSNKEVEIIHEPFKTEFIETSESRKIIAVIFQNLDYNLDIKLSDIVLSRFGNQDVCVYVYLHPGISSSGKHFIMNHFKSWENVSVIPKERHKNINLAVCRFSALGLEYHSIGVKTVFCPFGVTTVEMQDLHESVIFERIEDFEKFIMNYELR